MHRSQTEAGAKIQKAALDAPRELGVTCGIFDSSKCLPPPFVPDGLSSTFRTQSAMPHGALLPTETQIQCLLGHPWSEQPAFLQLLKKKGRAEGLKGQKLLKDSVSTVAFNPWVRFRILWRHMKPHRLGQHQGPTELFFGQVFKLIHLSPASLPHGDGPQVPHIALLQCSLLS
ncbi:UNVERIFIED_CONTAM: hypothetical protein K2H54_020574 [Gekko kuhli]